MPSLLPYGSSISRTQAMLTAPDHPSTDGSHPTTASGCGSALMRWTVVETNRHLILQASAATQSRKSYLVLSEFEPHRPLTTLPSDTT